MFVDKSFCMLGIMTAKTVRTLTSTQEDYLEAIFRLEKANGAARARDIADALGVSRPTVTSALRTLAERNYIGYEPYSLVRLTPEGEAVAKEIFHRHVVLEAFFREILKLDPQTADTTACQCEHAVNNEVITRLGQFVLFLEEKGFHDGDWRQEYEELKHLGRIHGGLFKRS